MSVVIKLLVAASKQFRHNYVLIIKIFFSSAANLRISIYIRPIWLVGVCYPQFVGQAANSIDRGHDFFS